ncbi:MAG: hypothetical protein WC381_04460 [Kiritimatiellia bacterium]|jgi:hypothetical protein
MKKNQLNETLRAWARRRECGEQRLQALTDAIMQSLPRHPCVFEPEDAPAMRRLNLWPSVTYIAMGAAAMLAIVLGINLARPHTALPISSSLGLPANYAVSKAVVIREMSRLFSGQLRWVAENNGDIKVGIDSETSAREGDSTSAWIQTVVVTRRAGESTWRPVWSTAVQVHNDEQVELTLPADSEGRLMLWAYAVDKDKWAVDSLCAWTTPVRLSSESSEIIETGKYQEIAALKTDNREYRVFQTVLNMKPDRNS